MTKSSKPILQKSVIFQKMGGRFVAYDNSNAQLHEINETGAFIIEQIKKKRSLDDIAKELMRTYEVPNKKARSDIEKFIQLLEKKGIISTK